MSLIATIETADRCKFIFFEHDGKEWLRFVDFWGHEVTVTLSAALKIFSAEKRRRSRPAVRTKYFFANSGEKGQTK